MFGAGFRASRRVLTSGLKALPFLAVAKADEGAPVELVFDGSLPVDEPVKKVHHPHGSEIDHEADLMRVPSDYISNPGLYDEMQAEGRLFDLDEYEGLKIDYLRPLQPGVSLVHAVHLTGVEDEVSTYSCMAQMMSLETGEYVVARFDSNLDFFGRAQFGIGNVLVNMMLRNEEGNPDPTGSIDMNYFMPTSTIGVKLMPSEGQSSLSFYQTVSPSFSIGTEILHVEPVAFTLLRMGAKLFRSYGILSGMVGTNGVVLAQYVREFEPRRMALFTEYLLMPTQNGLESTVKFGYRQQFSDEVCVTTKFGTDWRIQTQLETDVRGLGKFSLLGNVDQNTGKYKMGVCLSVTN